MGVDLRPVADPAAGLRGAARVPDERCGRNANLVRYRPTNAVGLNASMLRADVICTSSDPSRGGTKMDVRHRDDTGVHGYTLVELLTIASIIAVLASIAIPMFISQRESAWRSAAASDARNAAVVLESVSHDGYPAAAAQQGRVLQLLSEEHDAAPRAVGLPIRAGATANVLAESATSPGVRLDYHRESATRYCLCAYHDDLDDGAAAVYDSAASGLVDACTIDTENVCGDLPVRAYEGLDFARSGHWGPNPLSGEAATESSGSLVLRNVETHFGAGNSRNGGWSISYGAFDDGGKMTGYEVQFNRVLRGFRVMPWVDGRQQAGRQALHDAPPTMDFTSKILEHGTVRVDVQEGSLALWIDDEQILSHDVSDVNGTFAFRDWQNTTVDYSDVSLTVE